MIVIYKKNFTNLFILIYKVYKLNISNTYLGIIFAIFAYLSFGLLDAIQKTTVIYHSVFQILFLKYFSFALVSNSVDKASDIRPDKS